MAALIAELVSKGSVVTDGAWGTELQARGLEAHELPDAWNLSRPELVREVAAAYVAAGSQVILTNTFNGNRFRLAGHQLEGRLREINREGVRISKDAAGSKALVFASMGPSGLMLMSGDVTEGDLRLAFEAQAAAILEGGADAIVVETMADVEEARIAVTAAATTGLPVVACLVYDSGKNKDRTMMGTTPEQAAEVLAKAGAAVLGANCGVGIRNYIPVCRRLKAAAGLPVWIKGNAGLPVLVEGKAVYQTSAQEFASCAPELREAGADFIGGCCGTNPGFIAALRAQLASG